MRLHVGSCDTSSGSFWTQWYDQTCSDNSDCVTVNDILSFGESGDKLLAVASSES